MMMFDGLTSRWTEPAAGHVVGRGEKLQGERDQLIGRQRAVATQERRQAGALDVLEARRAAAIPRGPADSKPRMRTG